MYKASKRIISEKEMLLAKRDQEIKDLQRDLIRLKRKNDNLVGSTVSEKKASTIKLAR